MDTTQRHLEPRARHGAAGDGNPKFERQPARSTRRVWLALVVTGVVAIVATRSAAAQTSAPATERLPPLDSAADAGLPSVGVPPEEVSGMLDDDATGREWFVVRGQSGFNRALNQTINHQQRETPGGPVPSGIDLIMTAPSTAPPGARAPSGPAPTGPPIVTFLGNIYINAGYSGRVAVIGDSTRLNSTLTNGTFLASAIPVPGQPFYGTKEQAAVQGAGSSLALNGQILTDADNAIQFSTKFLTQNTGISTDPTNPSTNNPSVSIQQAYARLSKVLVGVSESGFAPIDNSALPETLDLAGPGARVSVLSLGSTGAGQGRFSYYLFSTNDNRPGFTGIVSAENPVPEITTRTAAAGTYGTMSRCPDFTTTLRYSGGDFYGKDYIELSNLQFATVWRCLGVETSDATVQREAFGWGLSLSGGYRFFLNPNLSVVDGVFFSVTYGQGLGHYILDLHGQNADATLTASNVLTPLPVLAWYAGYLHNWSDAWRSSAYFSHVDLQSINPPGVTNATSPYQIGESVGVNLVYHKLFYLNDNTKSPHQFFTGIEAIWGERENLNHSVGTAERLMWVTSISN